MTTTAQYVADLQAKQRALRHATSLPLLATALGMGFLTYRALATDWWIYSHELVPAITFGALLVVMLVQRHVLGIGTGRDRYGMLALFLLVLAYFPLSALAFFSMGEGFFLGLGLVVLGWRSRDLWLLAPGLGLMAVSPLATLGTLDNHAPFLGGREGGLVISTTLLLLLAVAALVRERRVVAGDSEAPA